MIVRLAQEFGKSEKRRCGAFDASSWFPNPYTADVEGSARETRKSRSIEFTSEVETGPRQENASKQESQTPILIQSKPIRLWRAVDRSMNEFRGPRYQRKIGA
jgi:hypothetical protein